MTETPEDSDFTSIQERLRQFAEAHQTEAPAPADPVTEQPADLLPFIGGEHAENSKGIAFTLPDYLELVDWTGRAVRDDKRGAIPAHIQNFGRRYCLAAGAVDRLRAFSQQTGPLLAPGRWHQSAAVPTTTQTTGGAEALHASDSRGWIMICCPQRPESSMYCSPWIAISNIIRISQSSHGLLAIGL